MSMRMKKPVEPTIFKQEETITWLNPHETHWGECHTFLGIHDRYGVIMVFKTDVRFFWNNSGGKNIDVTKHIKYIASVPMGVRKPNKNGDLDR